MKTIQVNVQNDLIALVGEEGIKKLIEDELAFQKFRILEQKIQNALSQTDINWKEEFEKKRQEAFEEYQQRRFGKR